MWTSALLSCLPLLALVNGDCHSYEKDYYAELGCKPEGQDQAGCPTSYDCSSLSSRSQEKCYYQGNEYEPGHKLERTPATSCLAECRCGTSALNPKLAFSCISIECPELFMGPPPAGCYRTYEHGNCCHKQQICGETAEQKTGKPTCQYKGETLQVGQKFYPDEEPCMQCICMPGYNGTFVEPFCRKVHCNLELMDGQHILDGCIPVYYGDKGCCPIDWRCPEKSDTVVASETSSDAKTVADSEKTCKFGSLTMHIGEKLSPSSARGVNTECTCRVPPHPVCIQKENPPHPQET